MSVTIHKGQSHDVMCMTVQELIELVKSPLPEHNAARIENVKFNPERNLKKWYNAKSQEEIDAIVLSGWGKGVTRLQSLREKLSVDLPPRPDVRRRRQRREDGDELLTERALCGQWETAWECFRRAEAPAYNTIELVCPIGGNCVMDAEEMFWQGAVAVVIADIMEQSGYQVGLTGAMLSNHHKHNYLSSIMVRVKEAHEPLNLSDVAAMFCHAGVFRTYGFNAICHSLTNVSETLGTSIYNDETARQQVAESGLIDANTVWLGTARDEASARELVKKTLQQLQQGTL